MNNIFDLERFGKYFVYDLKTARSNYGLTMLIVAGVPVILYVLSIIFSTIFTLHMQAPSLPLRIVFFCIATVIMFMSFPAQAYGRITDKKAGSEWVLIPASKLEKYLSMVIITGIIVPLVFFALYFLTDAILSFLDPTYIQVCRGYILQAEASGCCSCRLLPACLPSFSELYSSGGRKLPRLCLSLSACQSSQVLSLR